MGEREGGACGSHGQGHVVAMGEGHVVAMGEGHVGVAYQDAGHLGQESVPEGVPADVLMEVVGELCPDLLRLMVLIIIHCRGGRQ